MIHPEGDIFTSQEGEPLNLVKQQTVQKAGGQHSFEWLFPPWPVSFVRL